jgi:hypothetical protein
MKKNLEYFKEKNVYFLHKTILDDLKLCCDKN